MNTNQSQAPFGVPETSDQKKPGKGLLIACISGFAVLGVIIRSLRRPFYGCSK